MDITSASDVPTVSFDPDQADDQADDNSSPKQDPASVRQAAFLGLAQQDFPDRDPQQLKKVAKLICKALDDNPTTDGWIAILPSLMNNGMTAYQAGQMMGLSTGAFCPQYSDLAPAS